ncbi:MAG: transglycosylase SLT domain-containing protein [Pseudomonadota bacterium]
MSLLIGLLFLTTITARADGVQMPVPEGLEEALSAIEYGDESEFRRMLERVSEAPASTQTRLFLEARWLIDRVDVEPAAVAAMLREHPDAPLGKRLKRRYLDHLAEQEAWGEYRLVFDRAPDLSPGTRRQCAYWTATLVLDETLEDAAVEKVLETWQRGRSQPSACDPVFEWLEDGGYLDESLYRARIRNAISEGADGLARYLVRQGPTGLADWRDRWLALRDRPGETLPGLIEAGADAEQVTRGLLWLARKDPGRARELLARADEQGLLSQEQAGSVARLSALKAAYRYEPQAYRWLREVPVAARDAEVWTWTVRSALRRLDWVHVKEAIDAMPAELVEEREWRYWRAVAEAELGQVTAARPVWRELAETPDFHGFLAAERLGLPYAFPEENGAAIPSPDEQALARVASNPWLVLAFALHRIDHPEDARRVFEHEFKQLAEADYPALAALAHQAGWNDRLAVLIARMGRVHDPDWYAARFPLPYRELVARFAEQQSIDPDWIYSIMRRESLFMRDIGSGAGAQGLMQLMPSTARWINRQAGLHISPLTLTDPEVNIELGAAYLAHMAERFDGRYPLAIAAYNAGPGRIGDWLPAVPLPGDVWVDTILFDETRAYTRAVLAAMVTYQWRREGEPDRLGRLLPVVQPAE